MLTRDKIAENEHTKDDKLSTPLAGRYSISDIPKSEIPPEGIVAGDAYQVIHDELLLDGTPNLNLSSFVTTWMDPEAEKLIQENLNKNFIDHFQYPQSQVLEGRCIRMLAKLFHAPEEANYAGTSTIGSSEAIMLALLAHKWKWKNRREKEGKSTDKPNIVFGAEAHVCWYKFAKYFDVEPRIIPLNKDDYIMDQDEAYKLIDENTICVGVVAGTTYTGQVDPVGKINDMLVKVNKENGWDIGIHVDGASGAFVMAFAFPDEKWDFRYERVRSINTSGHKYGLVYPGIGWLIFRDVEDLPTDIIFYVNYLGQTETSFTLNYSKPGTGIIGQYYNFLHLGQEGYRSIMLSIINNAKYLEQQIEDSGKFKILKTKSRLPIVVFQLKGGEDFTVFDVSYLMKERGWIISAYNLPANAQDVNLLRVVVRENFSHDIAGIFMKDLMNVYDSLSGKGRSKKDISQKVDKSKESVNVC